MRFIYALLFLVFTNIAFSQKIEKIKLKGDKGFGKRELLIYTPLEYFDQSRSFEVVYVLDAQSREFFDAVHTTIAFQNNGLRPMIVVGIASPYRNIDFLPTNVHPETVQEQYGELGGADDFSDFIENSVMPYVDKNYRTIPTKIGIGYSNGGTFINYTMIKKPELFDVIFSIDANFNYDKGQLVDLIKNQSTFKNSLDFYYTCYQPNMGDLWTESSIEFNKSLKTLTDMHIVQELFESEIHTSVYDIGVMNAFKAYFKFQFFDVQNLIKYLKDLDSKEDFTVKQNELLRMAVVFKRFGQVEAAKKLLLSFQEKLTVEYEYDKGYDIYALFGTADLYFSLGFSDLAKKYFLYCDRMLEEKKKNYGIEKYNMGKRMISEKLKLIEEGQ
jgi:predicted alpha/beta superfamily hydrolase